MPRASSWPSPEEIPLVGGDDIWPGLQQSLAHGLRGPLPGLENARRQAREAHDLLAGVLTTANQHLGALTCRFCLEPCCLGARVWLDLADLLILHLGGLAPPPAQLRAAPHQACRYLGPRGCLLPRLQRPFVCTWYLCPSQLRRRFDLGPDMEPRLQAALARVKALRRQLSAWYRDLL